MNDFNNKPRVLLCGVILGLGISSAGADQLNASADVNEWSSFATPALAPDRDGPVADHQFQAIKQGGPWRQEAIGTLTRAQAQLWTLIRQGQWTDAVAWLKQNNPDPNVRDELGATPLSLAAAAGGVPLVRELLRRGAVPDQVGAGGMTPLGAAAFHGHDLVVRELLRRGARTDVPGATGQLPLHLACASGKPRIVQSLMAAGADWRLPNRQGRHALAEAAFFGQVGVMQQMVAAGVPAGLPDQYGRNALHAAALGQQAQAVAWLRQHGVLPSTVLTEVLLSQADQWAQPSLVTP
ncbi:MAG: ankyrin repeat domain-containing protein [Burkholderiales bacterium]|nr:ankyrin repeat domain-containing protein [Burkholderiales bacterium]